MSEVGVFVRRLLKLLPRDPDVLLLQEVNSRSAHRVARVLAQKTGVSFRVAQDAGRRAFSQTKSRVYKTDTAIVINKKTMVEIGNSGFIVTTYDPPNGKDEYKRNARALVRERDSGLDLALVSIHIPSAGKYARRIERIANGLQRAYPDEAGERFYVIGGDFNKVGVRTLEDFGQVGTDKWWNWLTKASRNYNDSVYHVTREKGVDYIFVKGGVLGAGLDRRPSTYSDHRLRWATVGPDTSAPTVPGHLDARSPKDGPLRVKVTWASASDTEAGIFEYDVWRSKNGNDFSRVGGTANVTYYDEQVSKGTRYWYYVVAKDWSDNRSSPSATVFQDAGGGS